MANIYGVCPERAAQHKGYGDFVQHANPLKEDLLRLTFSQIQAQSPDSGFANNSLKKFQTVNLQPAQTLRNSFGCVQIKLGETPSLKLKADNSLIGLNSVDSTESVNPLIKLDYNESLELANSLIQLNYRESRESANSLIIAKTCTAGTSPNVLMKSDASHLPSTDGAQKTQKEKGSTVNAAFLHNVDGDQSLSCLAFLRWRRLISPLSAVIMYCAVLSPSSFVASTFSAISWGTLACIFCDLLFTLSGGITGFLCFNWVPVYIKNNYNIDLMWVPVGAYTGCQLGVAALNAVEAPQDCRPCGASIHNVTGANTMAFTHSTQTRPKFTYLFLGTPSDLPTSTPTVLRAEADTEAEARAKFIDWDLTFAAQIRTAAPSRLQLFSTDDGFMWIYEQRQEASHA